MAFPSITLQGNILTLDLLDKVAAGSPELKNQTARDYGQPSAEALRQEIQNAWSAASALYGAFSGQVARMDETDTGVTTTRNLWMQPMLSLMGYDLERTNAQTIDERTYAISHGAVNLQGFPVHIVGANQSLDKKGSGMRMSPHALVQEYLNRHENLYALVTNGKFLRLLRDSSMLTKLSYVEFDLTRIFEEKLYPDFAVLYRLLHVSRMPEEPAAGDDAIIEKYHLEGLASGSRIRERLSESVEQGILKLGTGLLQEPANADLLEWVQANEGTDVKYYDHLLKLIYRLLFLMVIEERQLIFPEDQQEGAAAGAGEVEKSKGRAIYYAYYSLQRLRKLAVRYQLANERQYDLWENLLNTFRLFENAGYGEKLGIAPLSGDLFRKEALGPLYGCRVNNRVLLETLRGLSQFDNDQGGVITVNYASLDVEEFGSVYEGLLEYAPVVDLARREFRFVEGQDRSSSGSHYTPDELVQPLIKHSLEHLIADRTVNPDAGQEQRNAAVDELLKLTVCDVACGSGHILLAAARRIGLEVARLRSQEEQPNPAAVRMGTRDAIRHCIYGVDKNPLAVELCKVALWLEAHVPGEPLNFLDHRIRNGDAIVGLGRMEELQNGIATEAFKAYTQEEKDADLIKGLRKRNRDERKVREAGGGTQLGMFNTLDHVQDKLEAFRRKYATFAAMPENSVAEIQAKETAFSELSYGDNWRFIRELADLQVAQFFVPKTSLDYTITDGDYFDVMAGRERKETAVALATAEGERRKFFHWFLAFPEVFGGGGFDCVLGNPPFLGNRKLSGTFGGDFLEFVKSFYDPIGSVDLVTYFFRRIYSILREEGFLSLISTNTIAQGDARVGGLAVIRDVGGSINHAVRSMKWPGLAAVEVALVTIFKGKWKKALVLDQNEVTQITTYLDDQEYLGDPYKLLQNANKSFQGSIVLGKGFVLEPDEAARLIENDPKNKDVLFPYLNGSDLNGRPDQSPSRWVINFFDWPERRLSSEEWEELDSKERSKILKRIEQGKTIEQAPPDYTLPVATDYRDCYNILERDVKPERTRWKIDESGNEIVGQYALRSPLPVRWWMYGDKRPELYRKITGFDRVLVVPLVSKYTTFKYTRSDYVYMHKLGVFTVSDFALLSGSIHNVWAWKYSSTLGSSTLNYSNSDVYETFPYPSANDGLFEPGRLYDKGQVGITTLLDLGLTKLYNQFHNPDLVPFYDEYWEAGELQLKPADLKKKSKETHYLWNHLQKTEGTIPLGEAVERIVELRRLHKEMDEAVLAAYGWHVDTRRWGPAIKLGHDFHEVDYLPENDRTRYTISPKARREVLKRLLLLNHEIHEAEERGVDYAVIDGEKVTALMREQLEAWLPGGADQLHWKTLKFLCTGEDLLPNLERSLTKSYKPFVTAYASGLENELLEKVFVAFNDEFQRRWPLEDGSREAWLKEQLAVDPGVLKALYTGLLKNEKKYTLGTMHWLLGKIYKPNGSTLQKSALLQELRAFVLSRYEPMLLNKAFIQRLGAFVPAYRNEAAHVGEVDKAMAEGCRDEVRGMVLLMVENERQDG